MCLSSYRQPRRERKRSEPLFSRCSHAFAPIKQRNEGARSVQNTRQAMNVSCCQWITGARKKAEIGCLLEHGPPSARREPGTTAHITHEVKRCCTQRRKQRVVRQELCPDATREAEHHGVAHHIWVLPPLLIPLAKLIFTRPMQRIHAQHACRLSGWSSRLPRVSSLHSGRKRARAAVSASIAVVTSFIIMLTFLQVLLNAFSLFDDLFAGRTAKQ